MSVIKTKTSKGNIDWKKFILPGYIVFSILFIVLTLYAYLQWVVYNSGLSAWWQQWLAAGQEQWYAVAIQEIITKVSEKCEPIALTAGDNQVDVVNVACLQESQNQDTSLNSTE